MATSLTRIILEHLAESGKGMINAFFPKHISYARPWRIPSRPHISRPPDDPHGDAVMKRTLSSILSRLKKEGLVIAGGPRKKTIWNITPKGRQYLKSHPARHREFHLRYHLPPKDGLLRIIIFDVPEQDRKKRNWLRAELVGIGYSILQKSVFIGTRPIPTDFIRELDRQKLSSAVHIIQAEKKGTIMNHPMAE